MSCGVQGVCHVGCRVCVVCHRVCGMRGCVMLGAGGVSFPMLAAVFELSMKVNK